MGGCKYGLCFAPGLPRIKTAPPPDVMSAFEVYDDGNHMRPDQLLRFRTEIQGEADATLAEASWMVYRFWELPCVPHPLGRPHLTLDDFRRHESFSDELNPPIRTEVHQDMTAPLSHYYCFTGHNSYLTGNQLISKSSEVPIKKALLGGVRAVELDLWPNSAKDDVIVFHGRYFRLSLKIFIQDIVAVLNIASSKGCGFYIKCDPTILFETFAIFEVVDDVIRKF